MTGQVKFESPGFAEKYHYAGQDLGAAAASGGTTFRLWSPTAEQVSVNLYQTGSDIEEGAGLQESLPLQMGEHGVWTVNVPRDLTGTYYTYTVCNKGTARETADPYAKACGVNGSRSMVLNPSTVSPEGWEQDLRFRESRRQLAENPVIWEVHIKDFSNDVRSGISEKHQGKYMAFTEENTTLDRKGETPTCLNYLRQLGITHVHLLPFYDYGSVDEGRPGGWQFNWGYDPVNYNIPEGSYSTDPFHGEVRILECKQMIQSLHRAGIAVVMDVVYNHTFDTDSVFQKTVPDYFYRMDAKGNFANGSMCGNDTASERSMFRKYMIDSVCYWAREYHLDGFRFDLMGLHDVDTMNQIRQALDELPEGRSILMYGEPWSGDYSPMDEGAVGAVKEHVELLDERISIFCDNTRDAIKGDVFHADEAGFVNGEQDMEEQIRSSVQAWMHQKEAGFSPRCPGQIISYVSAHDNYTLWDKLLYTMEENLHLKKGAIDFHERNQTVLRQNRLAAGICFTCLGIPFFQAGEEFVRTKEGLENSYNNTPLVNQLDWKRMEENLDLVDFYRGLIRFRRSHGNFYCRENQKQVSVRFENRKERNLVSFHMTAKGAELFVIYNANTEKKMALLPKGEWDLICDGARFCGEAEKVSGQVVAGQYGMVILERSPEQ